MAFTLRPAAPLDGAAVISDELIAQYVKNSEGDTALVTVMRDAAIEWVEKRTTIGMTSRPWCATFDTIDSILALGRNPVTAITSVTYTGVDGLPVVLVGPWTIGADGALHTAGWPAQMVGSPIAVLFTAGHADIADVPAAYPMAALLMLRHLYDGESADTPPNTVALLCDQDRTPVVSG